MALTAGKDYALARRTTWWFKTGPGRGTAVLTRNALYVFPEKTLSSTSATSRTNTVFTIDGKPPVEAIEALIARPEVSPEAADAAFRKWASEVEVPVVQELATVRRIRIFTGWFRRSVVFSEKESGFDARPKAVRPSKDELQAFVDLLAGRPGLEMK